MQLVQKLKSLVNAVVVSWKRRRNPTPPPSSAPVPTPSQPELLSHFLNDTSTPDLLQKTHPPVVPTQNSYVVQGFKGGGFAQGTVQFQAAHAYVTIGETINILNSQTQRKIPRWPATSSLVVAPRAGVDLNAFYDRRSLQFFYFTAPQIGGTMFAVDSADVVSHECGHGILDSYRPDLWNVAFLETGAFHECFGDFAAMMHSLSHDEVINRAIQETNGDLSKSNVISKMAEHFGIALHRLDSNSGRDQTCLRNAVNSFKYVNPSSLPKDTPDNQLSAEVHNFSRIFLGAIWDVFVLFYNDAKSHGSSELDAAKYARDLLCKYVIKAIQNCPVTPKFFEAMAKTLLWCDVTENNRKYHDAMYQLFVNRNLTSIQLGILSGPRCNNNEKIVKTHAQLNVKLGEIYIRAQGQDNNPLYDAEVEILSETAHFYDNNGFLVDTVHTSQEEGIEGAQKMIDYLHVTNKYGPDHTTPWEVSNNKLVRTRTCCVKEV